MDETAAFEAELEVSMEIFSKFQSGLEVEQLKAKHKSPLQLILKAE